MKLIKVHSKQLQSKVREKKEKSTSKVFSYTNVVWTLPFYAHAWNKNVKITVCMRVEEIRRKSSAREQMKFIEIQNSGSERIFSKFASTNDLGP